MKKALTRYIPTAVWLLVAYLPLYWLILLSIQTRLKWIPGGGTEVYISGKIIFDNYIALFVPGVMTGVSTIIKPLINSVVLSVGGTFLALLVGVPFSYAMSRYKAGGFFPVMVLGFRMFPPIAMIIPLLMVYTTIGLFDTHIGMILFFALCNVPFAVWLMKGFFDDIPREVDEAAVLDGCSLLEAFYKVTLPMCKTGLVTSMLFIFIFIWNDFIGALVLSQNVAYTIPFYLGNVHVDYMGVLYGLIGAVGVVSMLPCLILTRYLQEHLVRGLTFGAVKGV